MANLQDLKKKLDKSRDRLDQLHVSKLFVFGSLSKGENRPDSDVDILVEFSETVSFFQFLDLKYFLEQLFGCRVDLVTRKALHPALAKSIEEECVRVA